MLNPNIHTD